MPNLGLCQLTCILTIKEKQKKKLCWLKNSDKKEEKKSSLFKAKAQYINQVYDGHNLLLLTNMRAYIVESFRTAA